MWKSVAHLVKADLIATPIWELRDDAGLETARPAHVDLTEASGHGPVYVAATRYTAANGSEFFGFCSPTESSGLDYTQPVVLTPNGPMPLWAAGGLSSAQISALTKALGIDASELFPIHMSCLVSVGGIYYSDVIDAI